MLGLFQRWGWRGLQDSANKNNAPEEPEVLKEKVLKGIKFSMVHHWAQMVNTRPEWRVGGLSDWAHKSLPFLCLRGLASSEGCACVFKPAHISDWGKSGPVVSTSDLLIWLGAVGSVAGRPRFSTLETKILHWWAAWKPGVVEKLLTDRVGSQSHGLIGPTIPSAVWGKTGN